MPRPRPLLALAALLACGPATPIADRGGDRPPTIAASARPGPALVAAKLVEKAPNDGPIGVEACDHYVASYRRCIAEVLPAAERPLHIQALDGQRLAWAEAHADDSLAADLGEACEAATAAARASLPRCKPW